MKIGIIIPGSCISIITDSVQQAVKTMYGNVLVYVKDKTIMVIRNGKGGNIPSHRVNHKSNICALNLLGVEKIFSFEEVYSLKPNLKKQELVICEDFVDFMPESFFELEHRIIELSINAASKQEVISASKDAKQKLRQKICYLQLRGPRTATRAEQGIIKNWADVYGFAFATEATLSKELGLPYVCVGEVQDLPIIMPKSKNPPKAKLLKIIKRILRTKKKPI